MKKILLLFIVFISINGYSQKDSISNYLDRKFRITSNKNDAKYIETSVKKGALWEKILYYRDGKIFKKGFSKNNRGSSYVGKYLVFHRNGKISKRVFYDAEGELEGKVLTLFDNGNRNYTGFHKKGVPSGLWKYYHYNGNLAAKFYYDINGDIERYILFNEKGEELKDDTYTKFIKPTFKKGKEEFNSKMSYLIDNVSYAINTIIYVNFTIDVDGSIKDVWVVNNIPNKLRSEIIDFFESIKGWKPAVEMNRKIPSKYGIALNFTTRVID
ncbi:toxin-antitoxin system YwqK family antitoxin [Tenacibaculum sp. Ill]|uniref:toxin-antitoxin system YwqK family antitoxin n=1 Tax=Tenacibaculum sp. Ill TaxID=3445935 RepID=UPI003F78F0D2